MLNIDKVSIVYLACGVTDLRKSIDGLILEVETQLKLMIAINDENMLGKETLLLIPRMEKELKSKDNEINELKN